ncbi:N2,N2-dimethylguanosine tRNA methyltransferase [Cladochytrium replicatum]|nr:N2,N2-dimethylguanosine tRNA methyltransferase [Cladochytrium replicatum]
MGNDPASPSEKVFERDGKVHVKEGQAEVIFSDPDAVFYNPVQEFNRDLSIAILNVFGDILAGEKVACEKSKELINESVKLHILEALSATGLRGVRYAKEIPRVARVVANDLDREAFEAIQKNVEHNGVGDIVQANLGDATMVMYRTLAENRSYDVIDLDPYGSAAPFIDGAIQCVANGGMLCVTCTDMAVLAGGQTEACFAKYGAMSIPNNPACHEMGLRILLHSLQSAAARHKRYIVPIVSASIDFYVRVFVRVFTSAQEVKRAASKTSVAYQCVSCKSFWIQAVGRVSENGASCKYTPGTGPPVGTVCEICGSKLHFGGPFWTSSIHDQIFIRKLLDHVKSSSSKYGTHTRLMGMITVMSEEIDVPLYYSLPSLCKTLHCTSPTLLAVHSAILHQGYKVSISHASDSSIKTSAPPAVVWDIMKSWIEEHPVKLRENGPAVAILKSQASTKANFNKHPDAVRPSKQMKLVRFQENPTKFWGPKARARKRKPSPSDSSPDGKKNTKEMKRA